MFSQLIKFLLGVDVDPGEDFDAKKHRRRWSSLQTKEFGEIYSLLSHLVLSCKLVGNEGKAKLQIRVKHDVIIQYNCFYRL